MTDACSATSSQAELCLDRGFGGVPTVASDPSVSLELLGGFSCHVDGVRVADTVWRLKKARDLVKVLALAESHTLHREQLMDALWPDRDPTSAANNLNQAVHAARRVLGRNRLTLRDQVLRLDAVVDVDQFRIAADRAADQGTREAYRCALALYSGDLLPENRYDDWAQDHFDTLAAIRLSVHNGLASLKKHVRPDFPIETSSFIGRKRDIDELRESVRHARLISIVGVGGIGKTRLAMELGRISSGKHAVHIELSTAVGDLDVVRILAKPFDVRARPDLSLLDSLRSHLRDQDIMLVLDNCEHVLESLPGIVESLLKSCVNLTIVATSREALRVPGGVVLQVAPLSVPPEGADRSPSVLLNYESVQLFVQRAAAVRRGFELSESNCAAVAKICRRLDGLPLALELAASRVTALPPEMLAERIDGRFRIIRNGQISQQRHRSLEDSFNWSHELLARDEQVLFRRLSVFHGRFALEISEIVCADDDLDSVVVLEVLSGLVEKSLVTVEVKQGATHYRLLETVRCYARDRLRDAGEADRFELRYAQWILTATRHEASPLSLELLPAEFGSAFEALLAATVDEALEFCVAMWPVWLRTIDLVSGTRYFTRALDAATARTSLRAEALRCAAMLCIRIGDLNGASARARESLAIANEIGDVNGQWRAMQFFGEYGMAGEGVFVANQWLLASADLASSSGFAAGESISLYTLGVNEWLLGNTASSDRIIHHALSLLEIAKVADPAARIPCPINISETWLDHELLRQGSRIVIEDTRQPFFDVYPADAAAYMKSNLAVIARDRGDLHCARSLLDSAAEYFVGTGNKRGQTDLLVRRAYLELEEGDLTQARKCLDDAVVFRTATCDRRGAGMALVGLGMIDTIEGRTGQAQSYIHDAVALFQEAGDPWGLISSLWRAADLHVALGDAQAGMAVLQEARDALAHVDSHHWNAYTAMQIAEFWVTLDRPDLAAQLLADARRRYAHCQGYQGSARIDSAVYLTSQAC